MAEPLTHPAQAGRRIAAIGLVANVVLATVKAVAGVVGNSYALVADAIESGADIAASLILFQGMKIASTPPDRDHPYGHGKAEPLTAMIMGGMLFLSRQLVHGAGGSLVVSSREGQGTTVTVEFPAFRADV